MLYSGAWRVKASATRKAGRRRRASARERYTDASRFPNDDAAAISILVESRFESRGRPHTVFSRGKPKCRAKQADMAAFQAYCDPVTVPTASQHDGRIIIVEGNISAGKSTRT